MDCRGVFFLEVGVGGFGRFDGRCIVGGGGEFGCDGHPVRAVLLGLHHGQCNVNVMQIANRYDTSIRRGAKINIAFTQRENEDDVEIIWSSSSIPLVYLDSPCCSKNDFHEDIFSFVLT